jgi:hypothetical protein
MSENLDCSSEFEGRLRDIWDLLYRAVQHDIADKSEDARAATKEAYEQISVLLNRLESNLKALAHPDSA